MFWLTINCSEKIKMTIGNSAHHPNPFSPLILFLIFKGFFFYHFFPFDCGGSLSPPLSLAAVSRGYSSVHRLLTGVASLAEEHRLQTVGLVVMAHGLSCSTARGIFLGQRSNPRSLHCKADS